MKTKRRIQLTIILLLMLALSSCTPIGYIEKESTNIMTIGYLCKEEQDINNIEIDVWYRECNAETSFNNLIENDLYEDVNFDNLLPNETWESRLRNFEYRVVLVMYDSSVKTTNTITEEEIRQRNEKIFELKLNESYITNYFVVVNSYQIEEFLNNEICPLDTTKFDVEYNEEYDAYHSNKIIFNKDILYSHKGSLSLSLNVYRKDLDSGEIDNSSYAKIIIYYEIENNIIQFSSNVI